MLLRERLCTLDTSRATMASGLASSLMCPSRVRRTHAPSRPPAHASSLETVKRLRTFIGPHNGCMKDVYYFDAREDCGLMVRPSAIVCLGKGYFARRVFLSLDGHVWHQIPAMLRLRRRERSRSGSRSCDDKRRREVSILQRRRGCAIRWAARLKFFVAAPQ